MWELLFKGGRWTRIDRPYLHVPRGRIVVKVKAFILDDYSAWAAARGLEKVSRWAFGNIVGGPSAKTGEYVVALAENAAAEYVVADRVFPAGRDGAEALSKIHAALVLEALDRLPKFAPVQISGDDPRREYIERLARTGSSRHRIILQGGSLADGAVAVSLTRLFSVEGPGLVRVLDLPKRRYVETAEGRLRIPIRGLDEAVPGAWAIVEI